MLKFFQYLVKINELVNNKRLSSFLISLVIIHLVLILAFMDSASASSKTSQNKACLSSANSDLALEQKLLLLANSYKELERNKVPFTDLVYRKFLISLKDLQIQAIDIFPTMNSLWRRIKNEDSLEPKITNRDLSKNKVLPKKNPILIEEKLKRTENNDRVLWQSPEGDWKVQSAFKTSNDTFKTNFLVYEDTSYRLSDQLSQYFREGFTYKSQLLVRAAPESALDINQDTFYLFEYKDGKISKSLTQKVFKATKDFYFMFQNTKVPSIVKHTPSIGTYEYTHFELKTILSSELDSYIKLGNSVVFVFKPSYINSSSTEIAIFDFDGANYVQREFTANNAKFKKINYQHRSLTYLDPTTNKLMYIDSHEGQLRVSEIKLKENIVSPNGLSLNLLPLDEKHLMNLNTRSRTIEVYSLKANGVFEIIDTFSSHRIVDPIFHWKYLMNEDSKELLYIETENGLALRPLNLIGEWRVITNDSLYLIKGKKLKIVQKDSQGNFTDFWETQLDEVIDSINSLKLFENRYLVVKYGHYSKVIDIHSDNSQWIKIDLISIAGFREIQNGDFRHIVFYSSIDNRLSILTTSPFHKISVTNIEHEKNTRSNELVNILSHQSLSIEKNILNLGDSFHLRLYDLDSWN